MLDATLGTKDDVAVVVLGIGEFLNSEKPSFMCFGRPGVRPSRRERTGVNTQYGAVPLPTTLLDYLGFVGMLA